MATSIEIQHVYLEDGTEDERYSVTLEYTGHDDRWYAVRFEHHWVGESPVKERAWEIAREHARGRG